MVTVKAFLENKELRRHVKVKHAGMDLPPGFTRAVLVIDLLHTYSTNARV